MVALSKAGLVQTCDGRRGSTETTSKLIALRSTHPGDVERAPIFAFITRSVVALGLHLHPDRTVTPSRSSLGMDIGELENSRGGGERQEREREEREEREKRERREERERDLETESKRESTCPSSNSDSGIARHWIIDFHGSDAIVPVIVPDIVPDTRFARRPRDRRSKKS
ncbi:hypothetical protein MBM_00432 [Drepanopeziza brunnea f. sp. 'multigermtubi' MB_m1]|uniref:Uncharacterized protein n=1 Tax=Marssonina brunnea f. sp. multigermtubi (strain MB_m1) TaxID=1072389 RepID=K1Y850_MARBU|nr:uncharacterized protein MBM_00432 [Drepanopeziza brunnea f. sp. 'multigermtubi' MB_m1]EKD21319.1 hypothetical protein MBM_00432 [Drepanopeziza brunnea f. sp. 'multigermtubi' MB_m1]